jgi:hypothetical protein
MNLVVVKIQNKELNLKYSSIIIVIITIIILIIAFFFITSKISTVGGTCSTNDEGTNACKKNWRKNLRE